MFIIIAINDIQLCHRIHCSDHLWHHLTIRNRVMWHWPPRWWRSTSGTRNPLCINVFYQFGRTQTRGCSTGWLHHWESCHWLASFGTRFAWACWSYADNHDRDNDDHDDTDDHGLRMIMLIMTMPMMKFCLQGEGNSGYNRDLYNCTFPTLIDSWREVLDFFSLITVIISIIIICNLFCSVSVFNIQFKVGTH